MHILIRKTLANKLEIMEIVDANIAHELYSKAEVAEDTKELYLVDGRVILHFTPSKTQLTSDDLRTSAIEDVPEDL